MLHRSLQIPNGTAYALMYALFIPNRRQGAIGQAL